MAPTLLDRVLLTPLLAFVFVRTLLALLNSPFRGLNGAPTAGEHVVTSAFRALFKAATIGQLQILMPPFASNYERWCKERKLQPDIVDIPNTNIRGFWIGNQQSAKYAMAYFHGGAFVMPGFVGHLSMLFRFVQWSEGKLAIFCPNYTLAPDGLYPLQIGECVEAVRYVLSLPGRTAQTTLLGGDSCGGNLVLAVVSHVSGHPHPRSEVVKPLCLSGNFYGMLAIGPWVSSDEARFQSMTEFANRDTVLTSCSHYWIEAYKGQGKGNSDDEYITPEMAPASWWTGAKVSSCLVTVGEHETLRDSILSWADKFTKGVGRDVTRLVVGKKEIHITPVTRPKRAEELEGLGRGCQEAAVREWIREKIAK
ncbi:uncharacterized protein Z519_01448 [Cladophialophora bantiana CBS 173.52]|uniref:Alpha/beta hydrolase fold-3 domain-containing protein n=1 Tax=Cladophialophora bantiana (strain ATCC 10958 / CBS 173.52 / CDC B-1940 / NIH 8579) TaxID=1442370 RepID=A0A0D2IM70_CLAB1|nr:uncharacterized protein Z519_01448 [Cladophialophora bantiana CBS 173.52]KIW97864.1 hypothetical protein Z519_01448 [Cladophialophora bantiana CBS 173.52]